LQVSISTPDRKYLKIIGFFILSETSGRDIAAVAGMYLQTARK
jgi:hypothetical protein